MSFDSVLRRMQQEGSFSVEASDDLADRVGRLADVFSRNPNYAHAKRPSVPDAHPGDLLRTSPVEVLRQVGVATSFFRSYLFSDVARHWAQVRYCGTLWTNNKSMLTLSEEGDDVVFHHKVAQSEQLGIGFALVVAQKSLRRQYPGWEFKPVDADIALKFGLPGGGAVKQKETTKRRPDYFLVGHRKNGFGGAKVVVLECKGTHQSSNFAVEQLAKACSQVCSVEIGGSTPQGLMVASYFSKTGIKTHILDPPGDGDLWSGSGEEMDEFLGEEIDDPPELFGRKPPTVDESNGVGLQETSDMEGSFSEEDRSTVRRVLAEEQHEPSEIISIPEVSRKWFFRVLANSAAASALLFAGAEKVAESFGMRRTRPGELDMSIQDRELSEARQFKLADDLEFYGTRYVMPLPGGGRLEIDRGIEKNLYDGLAEHRLGSYLRTAHRVKEKWAQVVQQRKGAQEEAASVGLDGTVLRMRVKEK